MLRVAVLCLVCILGVGASDDSEECIGILVTGLSARQVGEGIRTQLNSVRADCVITCGSSCCETEGCNVAVYDNATTEGVPNCRLLTCNPLEACVGFIEETDATSVLQLQRVTEELVRKKRAAPDAGNPQGFPQLSGQDPNAITPNLSTPGPTSSPTGSNTTITTTQGKNGSNVPVSNNNTATTPAGGKTIDATSSAPSQAAKNLEQSVDQQIKKLADNDSPVGSVSTSTTSPSQGEGQGVLLGGDGTVNQSNPVPQGNITQNVSSDSTLNTLQDKSKGVQIGDAGVIGNSVPSPSSPGGENATTLNSTLSPSLSGIHDLASGVGVSSSPPPPGGQIGDVPGDNVTENSTLTPTLSAIQDKDKGVPIADDANLSGESFPTPPPLGQSGSTSQTTIKTPPPPSPASPPFPTSPETPAATSTTSSNTPVSGTTSYPTPPPLVNNNTFPSPPPPSTTTTTTTLSTTTSSPTTPPQTQSSTTQGTTTPVAATSQSTSSTTQTQSTITPPKLLTTVSTTQYPSSETTLSTAATTASTPTATTLATTLATEKTTIQSTTPALTSSSATTQTTPDNKSTTTLSSTTTSSTMAPNPQGNGSDAAVVEAEEMLAGAILEQETNIFSKQSPDSNSGNGTLSQSASTSQEGSGHLMVVVLASALSIGLFIFLVVVIMVGKRVFESWQRRHYSRVDYLVNGMYN